MGIRDDIAADWQASLAALAWQFDLGVDEVMCDAPIDRYDLPESTRVAAVPPAVPTVAPRKVQTFDMPPAQSADQTLDQAVSAAKTASDRATSLADLQRALAGFDPCELKRGARNTVFADGNPAARVLILGEAPGRDEDIAGRPYVGAAGQLLDRMFAAIGLSRSNEDPAAAIYVTCALPWRPPGDREPDAAEIAMLRPFVERHIALINPDVIIAMGNPALLSLTGQKGIMRARGTWGTALGKPLLPMVDPIYLLRNPLAKREAWADLLSLQARLRNLH